MFIEPTPTALLRKVFATSDCLLSLPILDFPSTDDPSGDLDATTLAAGIACPLGARVIAEYAGNTIVLFPCPHVVRSAIHVAVVLVAATNEGKDSWGEESKGV